MTQEEILQAVAKQPNYRDVYEFLKSESIASFQALSYIDKMDPTTDLAMIFVLDKVRSQFMNPGGGESGDTEIRKARISTIISAALVDGGMNDEENVAVLRICQSYDFFIEGADYNAIFQQYHLVEAIEVLKDADHRGNVRLAQSVDHVFRVDGAINSKERDMMLYLLYNLQISASEMRGSINLADYGLEDNGGGASASQSRPAASSPSPARPSPSVSKPRPTPAAKVSKTPGGQSAPRQRTSSPSDNNPKPNIAQVGQPSQRQSSAPSSGSGYSSPNTQPRPSSSAPAPSSNGGGSGCVWVTLLLLALVGAGVWFLFFNKKLKYNSPDVFGYVDLGLSVKWANMNLGADRAEDAGSFYAWGETSPKDDFSWSTYKWVSNPSQDSGSNGSLSKYCTRKENGKVDNRTVLERGDDAAAANLSGKWRMPTIEEFSELINECKWKWGKFKGVRGYLVTGKNGNSIFLPATGHFYYSEVYLSGEEGFYWSSSLENDPDRSQYLTFHNKNKLIDGFYRYYGHTIRPVWDDSLPDASADAVAGNEGDFTEEDEGLLEDEIFDPIVLNSEAGGLADLLTMYSPEEVTHLVIEGTMDARDFNTLKSTYKHLRYLDISQVKIQGYQGDGGTDINTNEYPENELPLGAFFYWTPIDDGMPSLEELYLPKSLESIGRNAVARATNLRMIDIPEGVHSIGYVSFAVCSSLQNIDLPSTLISIGNLVFSSDRNVLRVNCRATTPPSLGEQVFDCPSAELHVPEGCLEDYAVTKWGEYFSYIKDDL